MHKLIKLIKRWLVGYSPSEAWSEFGKQELAKFKKEYEDLIGVFEEVKELSLDYFINDDGCNSANYEFEFDY